MAMLPQLEEVALEPQVLPSCDAWTSLLATRSHCQLEQVQVALQVGVQEVAPLLEVQVPLLVQVALQQAVVLVLAQVAPLQLVRLLKPCLLASSILWPTSSKTQTLVVLLKLYLVLKSVPR